jgi:peptidoglycan/LPS O-acetylase OafA/YrhL
VRLLRLVLLVVLVILLVSVVVGIVTGTTGLAEKAVLVAVGLLLLVAASRVRRLGAH